MAEILVKFSEVEKAFQEIVEPLKQEIFTLRQMIEPPKGEFTDYELGYQVAMQETGKAYSTLKALVSARKIPHSKKGGDVYFSRTELKQWLAEGRRKVLTEMV